MKIRTLIENVNGRYNVQLSVDSITAHEQQLLAEFGDLEISLGGSFSGSADRPSDGTGNLVNVSFTLPDKTRRLQADFPVKEIFDLADDSDSDVYATVWADKVLSRITLAKNTLMAKSSDFVGETLNTI